MEEIDSILSGAHYNLDGELPIADIEAGEHLYQSSRDKACKPCPPVVGSAIISKWIEYGLIPKEKEAAALDALNGNVGSEKFSIQIKTVGAESTKSLTGADLRDPFALIHADEHILVFRSLSQYAAERQKRNPLSSNFTTEHDYFSILRKHLTDAMKNLGIDYTRFKSPWGSGSNGQRYLITFPVKALFDYLLDNLKMVMSPPAKISSSVRLWIRNLLREALDSISSALYYTDKDCLADPILPLLEAYDSTVDCPPTTGSVVPSQETLQALELIERLSPIEWLGEDRRKFIEQLEISYQTFFRRSFVEYTIKALRYDGQLPRVSPRQENKFLDEVFEELFKTELKEVDGKA